MATAGELIKKVALRLSDPNFKRWSFSEHLDNLNYGMADFARKTQIFRHLLPLETEQDPSLFTLKRNTNKVYFVEYDGKVLDPTSWRELSERDERFATQTGAPTHWYQDLSDITKIRIYPIPEDNDEDLGEIFPHDWPTGQLPANGAISFAEIDGVNVTIKASNPKGDSQMPTDGSVAEDDQVGAFASGEDSAGIYTFTVSNIPDPWGKGVSSGEYGVIRAIFASKLRIGYSYIPDQINDSETDVVVPDQVEEALLHWMMVRAYERDGETRELTKAKYFQEYYDQMVMESARRADDGFNARPRRVKGFWI